MLLLNSEVLSFVIYLLSPWHVYGTFAGIRLVPPSLSTSKDDKNAAVCHSTDIDANLRYCMSGLII